MFLKYIDNFWVDKLNKIDKANYLNDKTFSRVFLVLVFSLANIFNLMTVSLWGYMLTCKSNFYPYMLHIATFIFLFWLVFVKIKYLNNNRYKQMIMTQEKKYRFGNIYILLSFLILPLTLILISILRLN